MEFPIPIPMKTITLHLIAFESLLSESRQKTLPTGVQLPPKILDLFSSSSPFFGVLWERVIATSDNPTRKSLAMVCKYFKTLSKESDARHHSHRAKTRYLVQRIYADHFKDPSECQWGRPIPDIRPYSLNLDPYRADGPLWYEWGLKARKSIFESMELFNAFCAVADVDPASESVVQYSEEKFSWTRIAMGYAWRIVPRGYCFVSRGGDLTFTCAFDPRVGKPRWWPSHRLCMDYMGCTGERGKCLRLEEWFRENCGFLEISVGCRNYV
ncbi:hypothetical protein M422DRAFT_272872 [Sphaerobolus stellatus SS14]|uniref:Uncharacterized protein n=1 Tax=Sphaerobolus stellatus (strain SS14) TaxID=990650 RepID=A0A0C9TW94_SPHS4|nr:hypothetical protein M422DRAFT_272872 [Sphaerobolus stellatus SS14]